MRSDLRALLATVLAVLLLAGSASIALADDAGGEPLPTPTATDVPSAAFTVDDAQLRWGINAESNRAAFAPGTFNFFSAGKIADPGAGGVALKESGWQARSGPVHIEKYLAATKTWQTATWAGLQTDSAGERLSTGTSATSNHQIVIDGGSGTVDPTARQATVQWKGSFTVLYYSGYSFFYVSDPKLTVTQGVGTLTATLSGYGSSMDDLTQWKEIAPVKDVVLAHLGAVDLAKELGFTATPKYRGVKVSLPSSQPAQVTTGDAWGSFPQSFIDYQIAAGSGSYWYSSGGSADTHKVASPLSVSYAAGAPVRPPTPPVKDTNDKVSNPIVAPPAPTSSPSASVAPLAQPAATSPVSSSPTSSDVTPAGPFTQVRPMSTVLAAETVRAESGTGTAPLWIAGTALLALSVLVATSPFAYTAIVRRS